MSQTSLPFEKYDKRKGYHCPTCNLWVKEYKRTFNCNMALALIALFKYSKEKFVHLEKFLSEHGYQRCGDASYLRFFGLIERKSGERFDGSLRNGFYKISGRGIMFVENKLTVQQNFLMFDNRCEGFEGEEINIYQALGNKFNYEELMKA